MPTAITSPTLFPTLTPEYILSFQFSSWFPKFSNYSMQSTIIRPLSDEFCEYLASDGVVVPDGSEDLFVWFFVVAWTKRRGEPPLLDQPKVLSLMTKTTGTKTPTTANVIIFPSSTLESDNWSGSTVLSFQSLTSLRPRCISPYHSSEWPVCWNLNAYRMHLGYYLHLRHWSVHAPRMYIFSSNPLTSYLMISVKMTSLKAVNSYPRIQVLHTSSSLSFGNGTLSIAAESSDVLSDRMFC